MTDISDTTIHAIIISGHIPVSLILHTQKRELELETKREEKIEVLHHSHATNPTEQEGNQSKAKFQLDIIKKKTQFLFQKPRHNLCLNHKRFIRKQPMRNKL